MPPLSYQGPLSSTSSSGSSDLSTLGMIGAGNLCGNMGGGMGMNMGGPLPPPQLNTPPKRPRTILTMSQRRKFKQAFEINPKPSRKVSYNRKRNNLIELFITFEFNDTVFKFVDAILISNVGTRSIGSRNFTHCASCTSLVPKSTVISQNNFPI